MSNYTAEMGLLTCLLTPFCLISKSVIETNDVSEPPKTLSTSVSKAFSKLTPHENIYTIPNILTATRLIAAPIVGYLVLHDYHAAALGLFAYAGITDLVDGWIARKWKLQTVLGTVIDPMADKMLMTILTVCLAIKGGLPSMKSPVDILLLSILFIHTPEILLVLYHAC
jgi:phosphatidylglycerophosphate synthase